MRRGDRPQGVQGDARRTGLHAICSLQRPLALVTRWRNTPREPEAPSPAHSPCPAERSRRTIGCVPPLRVAIPPGHHGPQHTVRRCCTPPQSALALDRTLGHRAHRRPTGHGRFAPSAGTHGASHRPVRGWRGPGCRPTLPGTPPGRNKPLVAGRTRELLRHGIAVPGRGIACAGPEHAAPLHGTPGGADRSVVWSPPSGGTRRDR